MLQRASKGFTVMETLVCLVVMSVVVMGASALLLQSGRLARGSAHMAQASMLASELAGMLRQRLRLGSQAAWPAWVQELDLQLDSQAAGAFPDCRLQACDAEQALRFELGDWSLRAASALPAARLVLCRDLKPWNEGAARFEWSCDKQVAAAWLLKLGWREQQAQGAPNPPRPLLVMAID